MADDYYIDMINELQGQTSTLSAPPQPQNNQGHDHEKQQGLDLGRPSPSTLENIDHHNNVQTQGQRIRRFSRSNLASNRSPRIPIIAPPSPAPRMIDQSKMRFLFEKQLQHSDVNAAGRIVIPKRQAEMYLPPLESKEGTWLHVDDMDYLRVWTLKFRYWPNNSSRTYVLENTKDLVSTHGLTVDDYIMIFKDDENGTYVLRAKKYAYPVPIPVGYNNNPQIANNMNMVINPGTNYGNWPLSDDNSFFHYGLVEGNNNNNDNDNYMYNNGLLDNPMDFQGNAYNTAPQPATDLFGQATNNQFPDSDPFFDFSFFG